MQILNILLENFVVICLAVGLGIIIVTNRYFDKKTNTSFAAFVLIIIGLIAAGVIEELSSSQASPSALRYFASSLGYALRPAAAAILVSILLRRRKTGMILWLPILCIAVISFTSPFTHLMFWFDANNCFMRGPLSYLSHICSLIYVLLLLVLTFKRHRYITSGEIFTILFSSLICVAATVIETALSDYKFLLTGAMAVSCVLYYVVLYAETYKVDPLTGLLNRRSLYLDAGRRKSDSFCIISVDLNCLKDINDTQGHSAGDRALKCLADILAAANDKKYCPYRVGGDEFIILGNELNEERIGLFIDQLRGELDKAHLMASFGYAVFHGGDNFDDVCNLADAQMYTDKKRYKHRVTTH